MLTREKFGNDINNSKRWLIYALLASVFYALFNLFAGMFKGNAITGKVVGSYIAGMACLAIHVYQKWF